MSKRLCSASTLAAVALSAATAKTVLQVATTSGTNLPRIAVKKYGVFFDGATSTATPVLVQVVRQIGGTAGTFTSVSPASVDYQSDSILTVAGYNATVEPTYTSNSATPAAVDILDMKLVHPQAGFEIILPIGMEIVVPANSRLGILVTAPAAVNCRAVVWFEE